MKTLTTFALFFALILVGCGDKRDKAITDLEKRPMVTEEDAKQLVKDIKGLIALHAKPEVEDLTAEQQKRLNTLLETRKKEAEEKFGLSFNGAAGKIDEAADAIAEAVKKIPFKKIAKTIAGTEAPQRERFGCRDAEGNLENRGITDSRGSEGCP